MRKSSLFTWLFAVAVVFSLASVSQADTITLGLQQAGVNGGAITTPVGGTSSTGAFAFSGSYGTFTFNTITAQGSPALPEPNFQTTSINTQTTASGTNTINIWLSQTGLTTPVPGGQLLSGFTSNIFQQGAVSVTEKTWVDATNAVFGTGTFLASQTFTGQGSSSALGSTGSLGGTYSETVEYIVTINGAGSVDDTINLSAVPEPGSMVLFGTGLSGLAAFLRRRSKLAQP